MERKIEINGILVFFFFPYDSIAYVNHHSNVNLNLGISKRTSLSSQFNRGIIALCAREDEGLCTFCDSRRYRLRILRKCF